MSTLDKEISEIAKKIAELEGQRSKLEETRQKEEEVERHREAEEILSGLPTLLTKLYETGYLPSRLEAALTDSNGMWSPGKFIKRPRALPDENAPRKPRGRRKAATAEPE